MLAAQFETFERPVMEELALPFGMDSPPARCWLLSEYETALVQIQMDRFILYWRKTGGKGTYPRDESMRSGLEQALAEFAVFLQPEQLGEIAPNQHVTYVNHMEQGRGWTKPSEVASVFPGLRRAAGHWRFLAIATPTPQSVDSPWRNRAAMRCATIDRSAARASGPATQHLWSPVARAEP